MTWLDATKSTQYKYWHMPKEIASNTLAPPEKVTSGKPA
jgi:hypothetical protein